MRTSARMPHKNSDTITGQVLGITIPTATLAVMDQAALSREATCTTTWPLAQRARRQRPGRSCAWAINTHPWERAPGLPPRKSFARSRLRVRTTAKKLRLNRVTLGAHPVVITREPMVRAALSRDPTCTSTPIRKAMRVVSRFCARAKQPRPRPCSRPSRRPTHRPRIRTRSNATRTSVTIGRARPGARASRRTRRSSRSSKARTQALLINHSANHARRTTTSVTATISLMKVLCPLLLLLLLSGVPQSPKTWFPPGLRVSM